MLIRAGVDAIAHADIYYGVVAVGSLVPTNFTDFGVLANFDAFLNGSLTISAQALVSRVF